MKKSRERLLKSFGPGIILAGAAIGGSHLFSSTTAGARFGFSLFSIILLTNILKYPFLLVGTRFTSSTGKSLLEGFQERNKLYLPIFLIVSLITGTLTISAVSLLSGALLTNIPYLSDFKSIDLSIFILILSGFILLIGKYKALDRISKFLVTLLVLFTSFAVISLLMKGSINQDLNYTWINPDVSPWNIYKLGFLISLMGWMPCPVELCVWPSLWMFSRKKETKYMPTVSEAEFDFNLGYLITIITALFFLFLGAVTMYGTDEAMLGGSAFASNLITLYTSSIGDWAKWIIIPSSFAAMFSTTLTCLDAYPRSVSSIQGLLTGKDQGRMESSFENSRFQVWMVMHIFSSLLALIIAKSGGIGLKDFVFGAMTGSFLTAPIFAWMAMDTINSNLVPRKYHYGTFLNCLSWLGLLFLILFSLLFVANKFFGLGAT